MKGSQIKKLMGSVVMVDAVMRRHKKYAPRGSTIWWDVEERASPRPAWIVGIRNVMTGEVEWGYGGEGAVFKETEKRIPVILVAWFPTESPVKIPLDGFHIPEEGENAIPFCSSFGDTRERQEKNRKFLSNYSKEFKRDSSGRFVEE